MTKLELAHSQGPTVTTTMKLTPGIHAGQTSSTRFDVTVPSATGILAINACADTAGAVAPQCNLLGLCKKVALPVAAGMGPVATLIVDTPVLPGQEPSISWAIRNDCADLGLVTATVSFGGQAIYKSPQLGVGLHSSSGESKRSISKQAIFALGIQKSFWKTGKHPLKLEITVTGTSPSPPPAFADMTVIPELVDASWWAWGTPPASPSPPPAFSWKIGYTIAGVLINRGQFSSMMPKVLIFTEHLSGAPDSSGDITYPTVSSLRLLSTFGDVMDRFLADTPSIIQTWEWFDQTIFRFTGPLSRSFVYTVEFSLEDDLDNGYSSFSSAVPVSVTVSPKKISLQQVASGQLRLALLCFAVGAPATGVFGAIGAAILAIGWALWGLSIRNIALANDPPAPDFRYDELVSLVPPASPPLPAEAPPSLVALFSILELLNRVDAAYEAMGRSHRKMLGAYIDGAAESLRSQAESYKEAKGVLLRAAEYLPYIVAEADPAFAADEVFAPGPLRETLEAWKRKGLPDSVHELWSRAGLPEEALPRIEEVIRKFDVETLPHLRVLFRQLSEAIVEFARMVDVESVDILALVDIPK